MFKLPKQKPYFSLFWSVCDPFQLASSEEVRGYGNMADIKTWTRKGPNEGFFQVTVLQIFDFGYLPKFYLVNMKGSDVFMFAFQALF